MMTLVCLLAALLTASTLSAGSARAVSPDRVAAPAAVSTHVDHARVQGMNARPVSARASCHVPNCWAAIALDFYHNVAYGVVNYATKSGVRRAAHHYCTSHSTRDRYCRWLASARNQCVAIARVWHSPTNVHWAAGFARNKRAAKRQARHKLQRRIGVSGRAWGVCPAQRH